MDDEERRKLIEAIDSLTQEDIDNFMSDLDRRFSAGVPTPSADQHSLEDARQQTIAAEREKERRKRIYAFADDYATACREQCGKRKQGRGR